MPAGLGNTQLNLPLGLSIGNQTLTERDVEKIHFIIGLIDYLMSVDPTFNSRVIAYSTIRKLNGDDDELR